MISSLRGVLVHKDPVGAVIECGGVGYGVAMSLASLSRLPAEGQEVRVWVHTHVSQDSLRLFGFADPEEKRLFEVLIGTTGVGPKLALAVLSTLSAEELRLAVASSNLPALVRVPGVGKKTAERLLLELRDRLPEPEQEITAAAALRADVVSALENLGFARAAAEKAADGALASAGGEADLAALVRSALRSA